LDEQINLTNQKTSKKGCCWRKFEKVIEENGCENFDKPTFISYWCETFLFVVQEIGKKIDWRERKGGSEGTFSVVFDQKWPTIEGGDPAVNLLFLSKKKIARNYGD
jgi:hypothetical protein